MGNAVSQSTTSSSLSLGKNGNNTIKRKTTFATAAMAKYMSLTKEQVFLIRREVNVNGTSTTAAAAAAAAAQQQQQQQQPKLAAKKNYKGDGTESETNDTNNHLISSLNPFHTNNSNNKINNNKWNGLFVTRDVYMNALVKAKVRSYPDMEVLGLIYTVLDVECEGLVSTDELCVGISMLACPEATDFEAILRFAIKIYFYCNNTNNTNNTTTTNNDNSGGTGSRDRTTTNSTIASSTNRVAKVIMLKLNQNITSSSNNNKNNSTCSGMISSKDAVCLLRSMSLTASYLGDTDIIGNFKIYKLVDKIFDTISLLMDDNSTDNLMSQGDFCHILCQDPFVRSILFQTEISTTTGSTAVVTNKIVTSAMTSSRKTKKKNLKKNTTVITSTTGATTTTTTTTSTIRPPVGGNIDQGNDENGIKSEEEKPMKVVTSSNHMRSTEPVKNTTELYSPLPTQNPTPVEVSVHSSRTTKITTTSRTSNAPMTTMSISAIITTKPDSALMINENEIKVDTAFDDAHTGENDYTHLVSLNNSNNNNNKLTSPPGYSSKKPSVLTTIPLQNAMNNNNSNSNNNNNNNNFNIGLSYLNYLPSARTVTTMSEFASFISSTRQKPIVESYFTGESCTDEENTTVFTFPEPADDTDVENNNKNDDKNKNGVVFDFCDDRFETFEDVDPKRRNMYNNMKNANQPRDNDMGNKYSNSSSNNNNNKNNIRGVGPESNSLSDSETTTEFFPRPRPRPAPLSFTDMQRHPTLSTNNVPKKEELNQQHLVSNDGIGQVTNVEHRNDDSGSTSDSLDDLSSHMSKPMTPLALVHVDPHHA